MRLIDADALKGQIRETIKVYKTNGKFDEPLARFCKLLKEEIKAIDHAPTIDAEPAKHEEWVPCSERLPNKGKLYIVTLKTFSDDYRFIDLLYYGKPLMPNCKVKGACWYRSDSEWGDVVYDDTDILAWMPLLKPYREESEVEE